MRTWIFGDSFGASTDDRSWARLISNSVVLASNGSSEYRIWKTYQDCKHQIKPADRIIFCHTSPSRVFLKDNAELESRTLVSHPTCDLLINDADEQYSELLKTIWSTDYTNDTFNLLVADLMRVPNSIHITFFKNDCITSLEDIWHNFKGDINHLSVFGNKIVHDTVNKLRGL